MISSEKPQVALLDWMLPDGNGVTIGAHLKRRNPKIEVVIMTGTQLPPDEMAVCDEYRLHFLPKPFLTSQVIGMISEFIAPAQQAAQP